MPFLRRIPPNLTALGVLVTACAVGCGGKAIIDPVEGSGGAGGATGSGSSNTGGQRSCDDLSAAYALALESAHVCNPEPGTAQCTELVSDTLLCPCRSTFVNAGSAAFAELTAIGVEWLTLGCPQGDVNCPPVACVQPVKGACVANPGDPSASGECQDF
ncbi:MAG: hypothetical protein VB934_05750 [Polyangiaceae bacterium]